MLLAFAIMDHASLLGLGHLDMVGMRQLCTLEDVGDVFDDMLIEGAGGGSRGDGGKGDGGDGVALGGNGGGVVESSGGDNAVGH